MNVMRLSRLAAVAAALVLTGGLHISASNTPTDAAPPGTQLHLEDKEAPALPPGFTILAHLPNDSERIVILAEKAIVNVKRDPQAADITVASNCPHDWNLSGTMIRQAGFSTPQSGVQMKADQLGSRAIVNGKIYPLPQGGSMGGFQLSKDGVKIGGQSVEPLKGFDLPGTCEGPDSVSVIVPASYAGDLVLGASSTSQIDVSSWKGGSVTCHLLGSSCLSAGKLSDLTKAIIDLQGSGKADVQDVTAKIFVANVSGDGSVDIQGGKAEVSNATVSGTGKIKMHGDFQHLKQAVEGKGSIKVN